MSLRNDPNYFPQPDVPTNGNYDSSFGKEQLYYNYLPRSADIDAANAAAGEKTYSSGKYVFNPATGQYTWVPASAATPATTTPTTPVTTMESPAGGEKGAGNDDGSGGFPGSTMVGGISGPTTGLASLANSLAANLGTRSTQSTGLYSGALRGLSDAIARNVDPNFSHEGRSGRGASDSGTDPNTGNTGTSTNTGNTGMSTGTTGGSPAQAGDIGGGGSYGGYDGGDPGGSGARANGGMIGTKKIKRFNDGGDAGYGYGEGAGAAQGSGYGGYGSSGEGYASGYEVEPTLINQSNIANMSNRKSSLPAYDSVLLAQSLEPMRPTLAGHTSGIITGIQDANNNVSRNVYGYQDVQQARDAYESLVAEQGMRNNIDSNTFSEGADGRAKGGYINHYAQGGLGSLGGYSDGGRLLRGPGDGVSDSIPATIGRKKQPARLADGEFVVPARIVSELGNGSTEAGARKLYAMLARIQAGRSKSMGKNRVAVNSRMDKNLPA